MSETAASQTSYLTQEAYERLQAELEHLSGDGRADISRRIEAAREEGDLRENGGYHAAKEEQGKMEARIRQLQMLLEHATVGETPADDGIVEPGMVVTVETGDEQMSFLLGSREIASDDVAVYSEKSPIGQAVMGAKAGDQVSYIAPNRKEFHVKILKAVPYGA